MQNALERTRSAFAGVIVEEGKGSIPDVDNLHGTQLPYQQSQMVFY